MVTCKDDSSQSISVQLDGKNYSYWSYIMKNFLVESPYVVIIFQVLRQNRLTPKPRIMLQL